MNVQIAPHTFPTAKQLAAICPFCGEDPPLACQVRGVFMVGCESDECPVNPQVSGKTIDEAWAKWNRRAA